MSLIHRAHARRIDAIVAALHLSEVRAEAALASATVRTTDPGEVVVQQGGAADALYVITQGRFEVDVVGASGATRSVRMLGPGRCFGEIGVVEQTLRTATVIARTDGEVLAFSADAARAILAEDPYASHAVAVDAYERHEQVYRAARS